MEGLDVLERASVLLTKHSYVRGAQARTKQGYDCPADSSDVSGLSLAAAIWRAAVELDALGEPYEAARGLVLAVSGGTDISAWSDIVGEDTVRETLATAIWRAKVPRWVNHG